MSGGILVWGDLVRGDFVQGGFWRGGFCPGGSCPGGFCPGGFCPGGFCPRTPLITFDIICDNMLCTRLYSKTACDSLLQVIYLMITILKKWSLTFVYNIMINRKYYNQNIDIDYKFMVYFLAIAVCNRRLDILKFPLAIL